jgi:hypothetical protein
MSRKAPSSKLQRNIKLQTWFEASLNCVAATCGAAFVGQPVFLCYNPFTPAFKGLKFGAWSLVFGVFSGWVLWQTFCGFRPMVVKTTQRIVKGMKQRKSNTTKIRVSWRRSDPVRIEIVEVRPSTSPNHKR